MKVRVLTLRFDDATGGFDDRALVRFLEDAEQPRDVIEVTEHFFVHERRDPAATTIRRTGTTTSGSVR